jgi:hypothetical protein
MCSFKTLKKMTKARFTNHVRAIAVALLILSFHHETKAQFAFSLGPKGGLAVTTFKGADADNIDARSSWFGGVFTNFQLGKVLALQPEFLLTERGADVTSSNVRTNISINYFEVPVLVKIRFPLANEVIFPHILLGPNFAFRTNVDLAGTDTQSGAVIETNTDDVKRSDIGALVGAGVDIQTQGSGIFFTIDGRYGWGFTDINDNDNMIALKNAGWTFAVGVGFRIGNSSEDADDY